MTRGTGGMDLPRRRPPVPETLAEEARQRILNSMIRRPRAAGMPEIAARIEAMYARLALMRLDRAPLN